MSNYFTELNDISVQDKIEKKNGLSYLSWAWAWGELKKRHPDATYTIYENMEGWNYHTDGNTCWVKTGVTVNGIECIEYLPVMDFKNKSIPLGNVTSFDVNKAIQRSLTKAVARHGLGLYVYAGEDLPECEQPEKPQKTVDDTAALVEKHFPQIFCQRCGNVIVEYLGANGSISPERHAAGSKKKFGRVLCLDCIEDIKRTEEIKNENAG